MSWSCPSCRSTCVTVADSRAYLEARYRRRVCQACGYRSTSSSRTMAVAGVQITVEATAGTRHQSRLQLERIWNRLTGTIAY